MKYYERPENLKCKIHGECAMTCCAKGPIYNLSKHCCAARLLATLPTKAHRAYWLERLKKRNGEEFAQQVLDELRAIHTRRQQQSSELPTKE